MRRGLRAAPPIAADARTRRRPNEQREMSDGDRVNAGKFVHVSWSNRPLIDRLRPIIRTLQALSLYPVALGRLQSFNRCRTLGGTLGLWALFALAALVNLACLALNSYITAQLRTSHGVWSEKTLTSIVTGLKPLINLGHLAIFAGVAVRHRAYLRELMMVDNAFAATFDCRLNFALMNGVFFAVASAAFLVPLLLRLLEYWLLEEIPGAAFISDISVIIVPLLSLWNVLPLLYFWVHCHIIRRWFTQLQNALQDDMTLKKRNLRFYYRQYLKLTHLLTSMGHMFNPYIFFTISWTVLTLCLSIYFATQATAFFQPASLGSNSRELYIFVFNMLYCAYQVILAIVFLGAMCTIGTVTNERAREIVRCLLQLRPADADPLDRFQVVCFMQKIQVQHIWGISVWRAVPVERGLMFTVVSAVITYGLLLLKLKGGESNADVAAALPEAAPQEAAGTHFVLRLKELVSYLGDPNTTCLPTELLYSILLGAEASARDLIHDET